MIEAYIAITWWHPLPLAPMTPPPPPPPPEVVDPTPPEVVETIWFNLTR